MSKASTTWGVGKGFLHKDVILKDYEFGEKVN